MEFDLVQAGQRTRVRLHGDRLDALVTVRLRMAPELRWFFDAIKLFYADGFYVLFVKI